MTSDTTWLERLREANPDWDWLNDERAAALERTTFEMFRGRGSPLVPLDEMALTLSKTMLGRLRPIAHLPVSPTRPSLVENQATLWVERKAPEHVLIATHERVPPLLWFPAGRTAQSVEAKLVSYRHKAAPPRLGFPRIARGFVGTQGVLEMTREDIIGYISMSPLAESLLWGSQHDHDPWPEDITQQDLPTFAGNTETFLAQREGAVWSLSFRAITSRAICTLEDHDGFFVMEVRYDGADHAGVIGAVGEQFGRHWPADFPTDVAALLLRFFWEGSQQLRELVHIDPIEDLEEHGFNLYALAALLHGDLRILHELERFMKHESLEVRTNVADIAIRRDFDGLLARMYATEVEPALRDAISQRL